MPSNLPAYFIYSYFCATENQYVFEKRVGTAAAPTVCKNHPLQAVQNLTIYRKIIKNNGPLLRLNGTTTSEVSPNYIDFNSQFYNVSDFGAGVHKVLLKVDDTSLASDYLWSSTKINNIVGSSVATVQYKVKVSTNDTTGDFLSSSVIASNNIGYRILNAGADEKYQPFVNTSDSVIGTDVMWSSYKINNLVGSSTSTINKVKVSTNDTTADFISSSIIASNNIRYQIVNSGADEKYQTFVNTSDSVIGTDVIWSSNKINSFVNSIATTSNYFYFASTDTLSTTNTVINTPSAIIASCVFTPSSAGTYLAMFEGIFTYPVTSTGRNQISFFNSNVIVPFTQRRFIDTQDTPVPMHAIFNVAIGGNVDVRWASGSAAQTLQVGGRSLVMIRIV